jgi:hypothetical protein
MTTYYLPFAPEIELGQPFGSNPNWGPNPPGGHNGDDWLTPIGTPLRSPGHGVVVFAGEFDDTYVDNWGWNLNFGGKMLVLNMDGEDGPYFEFGHNSELLVSTGDRIVPGQVVALTGNTDGNTHVITGPHSHVGCLPPNFDLGTNTYGRVNPRLYMTAHWDDNISLAVQGTIIEPTNEEDQLSEAQVNALRADLFHVFDRLMNELPSAIAEAVLTRPLDYADPKTGKITGQKTSLGTMPVFNDFQHSASRRELNDAIAGAVRSLVQSIKSDVDGTPEVAAEKAYQLFLEKVQGLNLNLSVGTNVINPPAKVSIAPIAATASAAQGR